MIPRADAWLDPDRYRRSWWRYDTANWQTGLARAALAALPRRAKTFPGSVRSPPHHCQPYGLSSDRAARYSVHRGSRRPIDPLLALKAQGDVLRQCWQDQAKSYPVSRKTSAYSLVRSLFNTKTAKTRKI